MTARPHLRQRRCPRLRPVARAQRGVYAIEFAFTFLLLFGLIYTIICYGILLTYRMALQNAAEEGARAALRYQPDITARLAEAENVARLRVQGWWPGALDAPEPKADLVQEGAICGPEWANRCSIQVSITMDLVDDDNGKHLFALPMPEFALPDSLTGQASVLLEGGGT
ncbi:MAG: TadE/TadG family type IV pilus assembly protein [Hydrogenophaga sp.]|uniref:TadE/TadG family type IV pilus assembly protein n=1 Tax=Hydrogenophaga sp. TaxID=1904254 RepID=UPI002629BCFE|nr:TadE/TadG family type IV pilus assembly protein [Hydrogenophaga sp.]MDD3785746.1 pilus assembly protein [Hydrogenophaga sp.]